MSLPVHFLTSPLPPTRQNAGQRAKHDAERIFPHMPHCAAVKAGFRFTECDCKIPHWANHSKSRYEHE